MPKLSPALEFASLGCSDFKCRRVQEPEQLSNIKKQRRKRGARRRRRSVTMIEFEGGESTSGSEDDAPLSSKSEQAQLAAQRKPWWLASQQVTCPLSGLADGLHPD